MSEVLVYTTDYCPYCTKAKNLLKNKNIPFQEIDVTNDPDMRVKLMEMSGGRKTVPQIFIDGKSIGGCDDLHALNDKGELDQMVGK